MNTRYMYILLLGLRLLQGLGWAERMDQSGYLPLILDPLTSNSLNPADDLCG